MKQCPGCGCEKPPDQFGRNTSRPDGLAYYCKSCFAEKSKASYRRRRQAQGKPVGVRLPAEVAPGTRRCPKCGSVKPESEFPRNRSTKSGLGTYCKPCHNETTRTNIKKNHGTSRHHHLTRRYGVSADEVEQLLHGQDWRCLICSTELTLTTSHVDHDHITGAVRGILCFNCNGGLGQFHDNPAHLREAADYIERPAPLVYVIPANGRHLEFSVSGPHRLHEESRLEQLLAQALADARPGSAP